MKGERVAVALRSVMTRGSEGESLTVGVVGAEWQLKRAVATQPAAGGSASDLKHLAPLKADAA